ncbi:hypothetical protein ACMU_02970 [Actibacterium mucosum KCTC 23349]|uniref:Histidine kinase/HSP90-like ATPase domain-containing protein n=1 Tax=Actibacterium mucosum KCTC 23349 TaxID=1454373 RepID=A0A037ZPM7_9RHOB|nr:ATP-binding protein [Actibacterium mucosum]KAJ57483.1 hypothetical protein ACMU_02970 [Actibacterium mucosum KCTC 23349]
MSRVAQRIKNMASEKTAAETRLHVGFVADPFAVRDSLGQATGWMEGRGICQSDRDRTELVLAEILNNIAEHAYAGQDPGPVEMWLMQRPEALTVQIEDCGSRLPGDSLPPGNLPSHDTALADLPEGGFGWFLVFSLTEDLTYYRSHGKNIVHFRVPFEDAVAN